MENKHKSDTPQEQKGDRKKDSLDRSGSQDRNKSLYNEEPDKPAEITDDPEGTKQKIPNMKGL